MRIRSRLLILVVAVLLPSLIGAALSIGYVYHEQQKSYRRSLQDLTHAMARLVDMEMAKRAQTLLTLAALPALEQGDFASFYPYARKVAPGRENTIVLADLSGQQLLNTRAPYGATDLPRHSAGLMQLRGKMGPDATLVSDLYFAPLGQHHSFAIQVPVRRDGRILHYLALGSYASQLQSIFKNQPLPQNWIGTIIDRNGVVAARSRNPEKYVGVTANDVLRKKMAEHADGTNDGATLDGTPVTAFFSRAPESGWVFIVSVPRAELQRPAIRAALLIGSIALVLLGFAMAAAFFIGRKMTKPMEDLRLAAVDLGQGRPVAGRASGVFEIDAINHEIVAASEKIRNSQRELEQRITDAVSAAEQSQKALLQSQKLEALGRLTGGIAHDFNNVLQTLTTGLQMVYLSNPEPRSRKMLESCQRAVQRAGELTRQLMAFGRVQDAHLASVNLPAWIEEVTPLLRGALRSDIALQVDLDHDVWPVMVDPLQFELAILNVSINARDAMPDGGRLTIHARNAVRTQDEGELAAGEYVQIAVSDSGTGMSPDVQSKALDPFYTTKAVGRGSGLGLPQAYGFAKQSGGTLTIDSQLAQGTTISFFLPRAPIDTAYASSSAGAAAAPSSAAHRGKILLVEDDPLVLAVVAPALKAAGFDVHEADNGEQAVTVLAQAGPFDAVLTDIVMPGQLNGIDLAGFISQHYPQTKIVLATGYSERRLALPEAKVLAKPYNVADVIAILTRD